MTVHAQEQLLHLEGGEVTLPRNILSLVSPGTRVCHDLHGDGVVRGVTGDDMDTASVEVVFPDLRMTWEEMISGSDLPESEDLVIRAPLPQVLKGSAWHRGRDRSAEIGVGQESLKAMPRRTRRPRRGEFIAEDELIDMLHSVSEPEAMVDAVIIAADWAVSRMLDIIDTAAPSRAREMRRSLREGLGESLWQDKIWPSLPPRVTYALDDLLADLSRFITSDTSREAVRESARDLLVALERRLEVVHGDTIQSRRGSGKRRVHSHKGRN